MPESYQSATSLPPASADTIFHVRLDSQPQSASDPVPEKVSSFRVLRTLGEGGMGIVYCAQQDRPRRLVALKVLKAQRMTPEALRRFRKESEALGRLQHRGIAQIYMAGTAQGLTGEVPFIAMELVQGPPLTTHAKTLPLHARLKLLLDVCEAVAYAHGCGVIHRDLKPSNILVASGTSPKVLDFGLSLMTSEEASLHTEPGQLIGTLAYMSPEQALGKPGIDARTDVYSLGVLAFELLSGHRPYEVPVDAPLEAVRRIVYDENPSLSSLNRSMRGDLDTIVAKALEKDRDRRYLHVSDFAQDIRRYLEHQPIQARPPTAIYRTRKLIMRHRALFTGIAAVMIALLFGIVGTTHEWLRATARAREAELRLAESKLAQGDALLTANRNPEARGLYLDAWDRLERLGVSTFPAQLAVWDVDRRQPRPLALWQAHNGPILGVAFANAGRTAISAGNDRTVKVWDLMTLKLQRVLQLQQAAVSVAAAQDADVIALGSTGSCVAVWDFKEGKRLAQCPQSANSVVISPDGRWVAWRTNARGLFRWCWPANSTPEHLGAEPAGEPARISNDGTIISISDRAIERWPAPLSLANPENTSSPPPPAARTRSDPELLTRLPGTDSITSATADGDLIIGWGGNFAYAWDLRGNEPLRTLPLEGRGRIALLCRSPFILATARHDSVARVLGPDLPVSLGVTENSPGAHALAGSSTGVLLMGDNSGCMSVWTPLENHWCRSFTAASSAIVGVAPFAGGRQAVVLDRLGKAQFVDSGRPESARDSALKEPVTTIAATPEGLVYLVTQDGQLWSWQPAQGATPTSLAMLEPNIDHLVLSPDSKLLACNSSSNVKVVSASTGQVVSHSDRLDESPSCLEWMPDSNSLLVSVGSQVLLLNLQNQTRKIGGVGLRAISAMRASPSGGPLFVGDDGGGLRRIDPATGQQQVWHPCLSPIVTLSLAGNGSAILAAEQSGNIHWIDTQNGQELRSARVTNSVFLGAATLGSDEPVFGTESGAIVWLSDAFPPQQRSMAQKMGTVADTVTPPALLAQWYTLHGFPPATPAPSPPK